MKEIIIIKLLYITNKFFYKTFSLKEERGICCVMESGGNYGTYNHCSSQSPRFLQGGHQGIAILVQAMLSTKYEIYEVKYYVHT